LTFVAELAHVPEVERRSDGSGESEVRQLRLLAPAFVQACAFATACAAPVHARADEADPRIAAAVAEVSEKRLHAHVARLVGFHTRYAGSSQTDPERGIGAAAAYIRAELSRDGGRLRVYYDAHPDPRLRNTLFNVVAELPGTSEPERRILVTAHYDSMAWGSSGDPNVAAPGASDNATGTACMLEVARILSGYELDKTVVFVAFSAEEGGLRGSSAYVRALGPWERGIDAVLNNDIVGNDRDDGGTRVADRVRVFAPGKGSPHRAIAQRIASAAALYVPGFAVDVIDNVDRNGRRSDQVPFQAAGFGAVRIVSAVEMLERQHNSGDTIDTVSFPYLAQVTRLNVAAAASLALAAAAKER
jgi:hypothetical protein